MAARPAEALGGATVGISSAVAATLDTDLGRVTRGVYVGGSGNLVVQFVGDSATVTLNSLAAGIWHPMQVQRISSTSTATGIVLGY